MATSPETLLITPDFIDQNLADQDMVHQYRPLEGPNTVRCDLPGAGSLCLVGVNHKGSGNTPNTRRELFEKYKTWKEERCSALGSDALKSMVIINEGDLRDLSLYETANQPYSDLEQGFNKLYDDYGEDIALAYLAREEGIENTCPEYLCSEAEGLLRAGYTQKEIFVFYLLRQASMWTGSKGGKIKKQAYHKYMQGQWDHRFEETLREEKIIDGTNNYTLEDFEAFGRELLDKPVGDWGEDEYRERIIRVSRQTAEEMENSDLKRQILLLHRSVRERDIGINYQLLGQMLAGKHLYGAYGWWHTRVNEPLFRNIGDLARKGVRLTMA